jgi:NDP-sugar pyrophosphorylase family protein
MLDLTFVGTVLLLLTVASRQQPISEAATATTTINAGTYVLSQKALDDAPESSFNDYTVLSKQDESTVYYFGIGRVIL